MNREFPGKDCNAIFWVVCTCSKLEGKSSKLVPIPSWNLNTCIYLNQWRGMRWQGGNDYDFQEFLKFYIIMKGSSTTTFWFWKLNYFRDSGSDKLDWHVFFLKFVSSGVELYQPTFLYAYVALLLQCGVLQAIGCVGALRLNQRLLNTYWSLLVVLMIGDILVGFVWAFRLDQIKSNLRPMLKHKLATLYGKDEAFTEVWDWVQTHDMCCGVDGPIDFQRLNGK